MATKLAASPDPCDVSNIAYYEPIVDPEPATPTGFYLIDTGVCINAADHTTANFGIEITYQLMINGKPTYGAQMDSVGVQYISEVLNNVTGNIDTTAQGLWCRGSAGSPCAIGQLGSLDGAGSLVDQISGQGTENQSFYLNGTGPVLNVGFPQPSNFVGPTQPGSLQCSQ